MSEDAIEPRDGSPARPSPARRRGLLFAAPWIAILVLIGVVQVVRAQYLDAAVFAAVAVAIAADAVGLLPQPRRHAMRRGVLATAAVGIGAALVLAPRHGTVAALVVAAVGVVVLALAWAGPRARPERADAGGRRRPVRRGALVWALLAISMCVIELCSFVLGRLPAVAAGSAPSISELLDPALDGVVGKAVFVAAWLAAGVALLRRGRR